MTEIQFSNDLTEIGSYAFSDCTELSGINLPNRLEKIGEYAFYRCKNITEVSIPSSVTFLGSAAFNDCSNLSDVVVPETLNRLERFPFSGTAWYNAQPDGCIYINKNLCRYKGTSPEEITIAPDTTRINCLALSSCSNLKRIVIPDSVIEIQDEAFWDCENLKSIYISGSVQIIGQNIIYKNNLTNIEVAEDNEFFDSRNGCNCIINSETDELIIGCKNSVIPDTIKSIGRTAFHYVNSISDIIIPNSVVSIGDFAFSNSSITSVTIPGSVKTIGACAFLEARSLKTVTMSKLVSEIKINAFSCCSIENVYYSGSEDDWNEIVFGDNNIQLTNATIHYNYEDPTGVLDIDGSAFSGTGDSTSTHLHDNVRLTDYPDVNMNGHSDFVIYREEWRNNRIELALYNTTTSQPLVYQSGWTLGFSDTSLYMDDEKYYLDTENNRWVKFENGYSYASNHCTGVFVSSRDVASSGSGTLVLKGLWSNGIPANAVEHNGHYYVFYDESVSWSQAKAKCEELGGHLVTVNSAEEQTFLINLTNRSTKKNMWIGAYPENGAFRWITKEDFSYTNWAPGEPNNVFNMQNAAMMYTKNASYAAGTWNDENENGRDWSGYYLSEFGYICEWDEYEAKHNLSFYDSDFSGYIGETNGALVIFDSADHDITEVEYESSNTDIVDIDVISLGEGNYITQGNEQIATIYLKCKKEGTATITATAPNGTTATLNVTVETKPAVQKSIAVFTTEKSLSVKTGDKMWLAFGLLDDTTQEFDGQWKKMAITNSDSTVVSLSDYSETEYGYSLELTGLKQGASHLTITDTETGTNTIITVNVYDQYVKSYSYAIDKAPTLYPKNKYEQHIATNIYNLNGLYVNNYSCTKTSSGYDISFDAYNSRYYSGAVDIYDATGTLINYEEIEKFSDISSLYDTGVQAYYLISDPITKNLFTYQQASFSKHTHISFNVPNGGYFTISNNIAESPSVALLNSLEILFDTTCDFFDLAVSGSEKTTAFDGFKASIKEQTLKEIREGKMEIALNTLKKETKDIMKKLIKTDFKNRISMSNEVYSDMSTLSESILSSYNINWKHFFKSATGIGESYFTKFAGPAGVALKGCFAITKGSNKLLRATQMSASCDNTYATFYSNKSDCNINQHGVVVNTQGNVDTEAVLQVFKVSNDDTIVSAIDSSFDKYELYNISFVKNDQLVQPSGKVTVRIPIPQGMKGNTCKVYRKESNNEWTILDAHIEGNYLVFETDHFSFYTVTGDSENLSIVSLPTKLDYLSGQILDTTGLVLSVNGEEVLDGYVCNPSVVTGIGTQTITIMYGNISTLFNVQVSRLMGDTNLDGSITISDVTEIQKYLAEFVQFTDEQLALADTNGDGIINITDATHLQKYLAEFDGIVLGKQST